MPLRGGELNRRSEADPEKTKASAGRSATDEALDLSTAIDDLLQKISPRVAPSTPAVDALDARDVQGVDDDKLDPRPERLGRQIDIG